jgi:hypothetical protein
MNPDRHLLVRLLDRIFDKRVIVNCVREAYLHRWYVIRTERIGIFVHRFVRSDEDRALHDHPWAFIVIPLWGGYLEYSDRPVMRGRNVERACREFARLPDFLNTILSQRESVVRRIWPIISTRYRDTTYRHRVELIKERPSWSIFIRFKKIREWGFWPKEGFLLWNKWWQDKCE